MRLSNKALDMMRSAGGRGEHQGEGAEVWGMHQDWVQEGRHRGDQGGGMEGDGGREEEQEIMASQSHRRGWRRSPGWSMVSAATAGAAKMNWATFAGWSHLYGPRSQTRVGHG